jgi:hypothetical protein
MIDNVRYWSRAYASRLIDVETPALLLPFLNCFNDILVVLNFHAFPCFQLAIIIRNILEKAPRKKYLAILQKCKD